MPKITFLGAGSTVFAKTLMGDILSHPELAESTIALHDIDERRLGLSHRVGQRVATALGAAPTFDVTTDRERALDGADYAINMIQVGGYEPSTVIDFEVPKRYGLRQTIGDTLGVGGIMRALRTMPVLLDMAHDMERLCPDVLHLNYVNPMAMNCMALDRGSTIATVGLCHSVPHTAGELARDIGVPVEEIDYLVAGINHMAFYLTFERDGEDLYPEIRRVLDEDRVPDHNRVRYELFKRLGYFVTESSEHLAEYTPWFIKDARPDLIERYNIPLDEYLHRCQAGIASWTFIERELERPGSQDVDELRAIIEASPLMPSHVDAEVATFADLDTVTRSVEYGSQVIHAKETDRPAVIYGNVPNRGLIDDLPDGACVEVPCLVDAGGVQPTRVDAIPPHLTAMMRTNVDVQELTVRAFLEGNREHVYHAAMLDPHTGSELDLERIWRLVDDLIEAHGDMIPEPLRRTAATLRPD
jgi:alpha-galactosidase